MFPQKRYIFRSVEESDRPGSDIRMINYETDWNDPEKLPWEPVRLSVWPQEWFENEKTKLIFSSKIGPAFNIQQILFDRQDILNENNFVNIRNFNE